MLHLSLDLSLTTRRPMNILRIRVAWALMVMCVIAANLCSAQTDPPVKEPSGRTSPQLRNQSSGTIQIFDNGVFDGVGKPSKLQQESPGEYTTDQYDGWVQACESQKAAGMKNFRDCFQRKKTETLGPLKRKIDEAGSGRKSGYRNVPPPSALDPGPNPAFDAPSESSDAGDDSEGAEND